MTILLFNDNPVVQKLVALSAQKTKDDLSIASSVDDIEESGYDLLILDDALYSDETFAAIKERITYHNALYMATRGNVVPAGFDTIINKPFLPTDLVETLILIAKNLSQSSAAPSPVIEESEMEDEHGLAIDLDKTLSELDEEVHAEFSKLDEDEFAFDELEDLEDEGPKTAILDHEELQEVRELLEDTENDEAVEAEEEEPLLLEEAELPSQVEIADEEDELDLDSLIASHMEETVSETPAEEIEGLISEEELMNDLQDFDAETEGASGESAESEISEAEMGLDELEGFEMPEDEEITQEGEELAALIPEEEFGMEEELGLAEEEEMMPSTAASQESDELGEFELPDEALLMDDEELGELESKIQEAVDELEPEDLDMELEEGILDDLQLSEPENEEAESFADETFELPAEENPETGFDELDMLDERELKMAIGEEVEEELDIRIGESEFASLGAEALEEVMGRPAHAVEPVEAKIEAGSAEGVDALQALLKALANEEVAKSLKGLNISININFGNDK